MNAETLRRAAALMRERAGVATPGPWLHRGFRVATDSPASYLCARTETHVDGEHIASWHPAVALAVADWLEVTTRDVGTSSIAYHSALIVARAYLGGDE